MGAWKWQTHSTLGKRGRSALLLALALCLAAVLGGCGAKDANGPGPGYGSDTSSSSTAAGDAKQAYLNAMAGVQQQMEDQSAPPVTQSIQLGNRQQLINAAGRWDAGIAAIAAIHPPPDIAALHAQLLAAMRILGTWNHRIAAAAPNKRRTEALYKQANASAASHQYGAAIAGLKAKGYDILAAGTGGSDGTGGAGGAAGPGSDPSLGGP
jgi:hypothetical protein